MHRAVSGIISLMILLLAFVIIFGILYGLIETNFIVNNAIQQYQTKVQKSTELSKSVYAYYYYNPQNSSLLVNITSSYSEPVYSNSALIFYKNGQAVVNSFPEALILPGSSTLVSIGGISQQPSLLGISIYTASGSSAFIYALPITLLQQGNYSSWQKVVLDRVFPSPLVSWSGNATYIDIASANISLVENNTIVWDSFETNPLTTRIVPVSGSWSWNTGQLYLSGTGDSNSGENFAYINLSYFGKSLPGSFYVLAKIYPNTTKKAWHDIVLSNKENVDSNFYEISAYFKNETKFEAEIRIYLNRWATLNVSSDTTPAVPFVLEAYYSNYTNTLSSFIHGGTVNMSIATATNSDVSVGYIGIGNYESASTTFDYVYVSKNMDPLFIYIKGVPQSYSVRIVKGNSAWNGTYDSSLPGYKVLFYTNANDFIPVLYNATIYVYDNLGNTIATYTGDLYGGSIYLFSMSFTTKSIPSLAIGSGNSIYYYSIDSILNGQPTQVQVLQAPVGASFGVNSFLTVVGNKTYITIQSQGLYVSLNNQSGSWTLLNNNVWGEIESISLLDKTYLVIVNGSSFSIVNSTDGSIVNTGSLPSGATTQNLAGNYFSSTSMQSEAYYFAAGQGATPLLLKYDGSSNAWTIISNLSSLKITGMTSCNGSLWLIYENGPLEFYELSTGTLLQKDVLFSFSPTGSGDKLVCLNGTLAYIRGEYTSEIWLLRG